AGKPVITTRVGGVENVVLPEKTAFLCEPGDEISFAEKLSILIDNPSEREAMGAAGWSVVGQKFHYTRLVQDMASLYRSLL
ncbi:MAG TPA: glycosyltransferase, partial [Bacteroidia bacterium]|nr:glycosyltransferase [Bacteroidia bacterium]